MFYREQFEKISNTGRSVLILKNGGDCSCYNKSDLLNSEPDINCKICYGTGKQRIKIKTEPIRYELGNSGNMGYIEIENYHKTTSEIYSFYFPEHYGFLNNDDLIVVFDELDNPTIVFEISNKEKFTNGDFIYYEIYGKKINFLNIKELYEK